MVRGRGVGGAGGGGAAVITSVGDREARALNSASTCNGSPATVPLRHCLINIFN